MSTRLLYDQVKKVERFGFLGEVAWSISAKFSQNVAYFNIFQSVILCLARHDWLIFSNFGMSRKMQADLRYWACHFGDNLCYNSLSASISML